MGLTAFIFPGQGSQYVGMARDFFESDGASREFVTRADEILKVPLSRICFEGPEQQLRQTSNTQPAIFLHSILALRNARNVRPDMVAGHSLGEYSALVAAGVLAFEDALTLVRLRGVLMEGAGTERPGTMAALVGLERDVVEEICREASERGIVVSANFNSPGQIAISGTVEGVARAVEIARARGAKMAKELSVSGAFHSPLMEAAGEGLKSALERTPFADAAIPVYTNVSAEPVRSGAELREHLYRQLTSPVRWEEIVRNMARDGATRFCEIGPGKVLQNLVKRTLPDISIAGVDKFSDAL